MKRWNGWGDDSIHYPLPGSAAHYLATWIGEGQPAPDAPLAALLSSIPATRLPSHPLINTDEEERLRHTRGQSLPDWVALRSGQIHAFPDGVAYPATEAEVSALLDFAQQSGVRLIPYGGGTSVVGHINPLPGEIPSLTLDLSRLNRLIAFDETSRLATFEAGVRGPALEEQLRQLGYTLGHYPQSFEFSTLGGWVATRSSGQQSYHYGHIASLFAGGHVETPIGAFDLPPHPSSAAGPDLRQLILGSEGRFGVLTRAIVRVRPLPTSERFYGVFFRDWESGVAAVRQIAQANVEVSMLRLSNAVETETTLVLSGKEAMTKWLDRGLRALAYGSQRCLLIFGVTAERRSVALVHARTLAITRAHGGLPTGTIIGKTWRKSRFLTPYLRNTLWEHGYAVDTLETAVPWSAVIPGATAIQSAIHNALTDFNERALVFAHLSHVYRDGASIYVTYLFRRAADPEETLRRWQAMKSAASQAILAHGGTISHQHGVGTDHAPYLESEIGAVGMNVLQNLCTQFDPKGILNPGKLIR